MKKYYALFIIASIIFAADGANCQSFNYKKYEAQVLQKAESLGRELGKDLARTSQFAMRSTKKEIYVLYLNGQMVGCFSDEFACRSQIRNIELRFDNLCESAIKGMPSEVSQSERNEMRREVKDFFKNDCKFTYKKENNPNYRESGFSSANDNNKGRETNVTQLTGNNIFGNTGSRDIVDKPNESIFSSTNSPQKNNSLNALVISDNNVDEKKINGSLYDLLAVADAKNNESLKHLKEIADISGSADLNGDIEELYASTQDVNEMLPQEVSINSSSDFSSVEIKEEQNFEIGIIKDYHYEDWPEKQNPNSTYLILPHEREKWINVANELLPVSKQKLDDFDKNMEELKKVELKIEQDIIELEPILKENEIGMLINEYKSTLITMQDRMGISKEAERKLLNMGVTQEEINTCRNEVWNSLASVNPDLLSNFSYDESNMSKFMRSVTKNINSIAKRENDSREDAASNILSSIRQGNIESKYNQEAKKFETVFKEMENKKLILEKEKKQVKEDKRKLTAERDDILKAKEYYNNVFVDGKLSVTNKNEVDAINLGMILNSIIIKK